MRMTKWSKLPALVLALGLAASACSSDGESTDGATDPTTTGGNAGSTLATVVERDSLICGVSGQLAGFSLNDGGSYSGIDVDYCKAVAAAVLGDASKVTYVDLTAETRFTALQSSEIDVLIRNGTWTASRDGELGLDWATTTYYDGQGMLVNGDDAAGEIADMDGYLICVQTGTTTELNLETYFDRLGISYTAVNVADEAAVTENFSNGSCDAYTTDRSGLASFAATYTGGEVKILPDVMSKEPLGPAVRQGDDKWFDIVNWVVFATFQAEEFGITSANVGTFDAAGNADIARFLGQEADQTTGAGLGFPDEQWAVRVIEAVGNYQEIFDRNIVPLGLDAGVNQLWNEGGLHYAPPYR